MSNISERKWEVMATKTFVLGAMCVSLTSFATDGLAQRGIFPRGDGGERGRGNRGGSLDGVQQRTYRFPETNEKIEYDVFVSRKADKKKKNPLVIALHGMNEPPLDLMR